MICLGFLGWRRMFAVDLKFLIRWVQLLWLNMLYFLQIAHSKYIILGRIGRWTWWHLRSVNYLTLDTHTANQWWIMVNGLNWIIGCSFEYIAMSFDLIFFYLKFIGIPIFWMHTIMIHIIEISTLIWFYIWAYCLTNCLVINDSIVLYHLL